MGPCLSCQSPLSKVIKMRMLATLEHSQHKTALSRTRTTNVWSRGCKGSQHFGPGPPHPTKISTPSIPLRGRRKETASERGARRCCPQLGGSFPEPLLRKSGESGAAPSITRVTAQAPRHRGGCRWHFKALLS